MRKGYPIRSNLTSEHVSPERNRRQLDRAQFGVYRPTTEECAEVLINTLKQVEEKAKKYLETKPGQPATFKSHKELGVTYLEQYSVRRALKGRHLDVHGVRKVVHGVEDQNYKNNNDEITVDLLGVSWEGGGDRKLTGQIEACSPDAVSPDSKLDDSAERIAYDAQELASLLEDIGAETLAGDVRIPEHVSMFTYRSKMPDYVQHEHKRVISDIASTELSRANITSVVLADVVVGDGYSKPLELGAL